MWKYDTAAKQVWNEENCEQKYTSQMESSQKPTELQYNNKTSCSDTVQNLKIVMNSKLFAI